MADSPDSDEYRPVSISALRSRFENLGTSSATRPTANANVNAGAVTPDIGSSSPALAISVAVPANATTENVSVAARPSSGAGRMSPKPPDERRQRIRTGSGSSTSSMSRMMEKIERDNVEETGLGAVAASSANLWAVEAGSNDIASNSGTRYPEQSLSTPSSTYLQPDPPQPHTAPKRSLSHRPPIPPKPSLSQLRIPSHNSTSTTPTTNSSPVLLSPAISIPYRETFAAPSPSSRIMDEPVPSETDLGQVSGPGTGPDLPPRQLRKPPDIPNRPSTPSIPVIAPIITTNDSESFLTQEPETTDLHPVPPRLPQRAKTITSRAGREVPPPPSSSNSRPHQDSEGERPIPPPPTRSRTGGLGVGTGRRVPQPQDSGDRYRSSNSGSSVNSTGREPGALPPRPAVAQAYVPPPPPVRSTAPAVSPQPQRDRHRETSYDPENAGGDGSDDATGEGGDPDLNLPGAIGLGRKSTISSTQRAIGEYPDSTNAFRRPPDFVPRHYFTSTQVLSSYAVCGHKLCVGGHNLRVYDLTVDGSRPIVVIDPTGIPGFVYAGKEPKITSLCFRAGSSAREEGRYVWCGTSVGHIFEVDIITGEVMELKAKIHSTGVTHIFRSKGWMITLEENGRCHVFGPFDHVDLLEREPRSLTIPARTIRTVGGQNYARLILNQLWSSTAPSSRSTTNAPGSKGPTIRVYDVIGGINTDGGLRTTFTSEWTGAVTAATTLPLDPDTVYLGHEGGYISIFDRVTLECRAVMKISPTDILALEGVGERLWAGYRSGVIQVYDVTATPWITTNSWLAHSGYAISSIVIDPLSITESGRFAVWSWARDALHAWDGLLSVEWIENRLVARETEFCSFEKKSVLVCSWNIGSCKPSDLAGTRSNASFLKDVLTSVESPDIIVFGFQEVIDLNDKKLTAKTLLFGGNKNGEAKGLADNVSGAYRHWQDKLALAVRQYMPADCPYTLLYSESMVGLLSVVFVKTSLNGDLEDASVVTVKRGLSGIYGNKGAIVARLTVEDTSICFINVHLAAGQRSKSARNADVAAILEDKAVLDVGSRTSSFVNGGNGSGIMDHEVVILSGDLNYRIDQRREVVLKAVYEGNLAGLLEHDQLLKGRQANPSFRLRSFEEPTIAFAPTYKYEPRSDEYDMSEKMRIPAWCDRVLYRSRDASRIRHLHYQRYEPNVSDHRPISAGLEVKVKVIDQAKYQAIRDEVQEDWFKHESDFLQGMLAVLNGQ